MIKNISVQRATNGWTLYFDDEQRMVASDSVEMLALMASRLCLNVSVSENSLAPSPKVDGPKVIKPTVGRIVWYRPGPTDCLYDWSDLEPFAAIIACVHDDRLVNLSVCDRTGYWRDRPLVAIRQPEDPLSVDSHCEWMPYQIGQAAKAEALQTELSARSQPPSSYSHAEMGQPTDLSQPIGAEVCSDQPAVEASATRTSPLDVRF